MYDKTDENISAKKIIGTKIAINSIIKTVKRFKLFKPKILKTRFWYTFSCPTTFRAFDITKSPIIITILEIEIPVAQKLRSHIKINK